MDSGLLLFSLVVGRQAIRSGPGQRVAACYILIPLLAIGWPSSGKFLLKIFRKDVIIVTK